MIIFISEDESYLRWIDQNPTGFVVNAARDPKPNYLILHRATCAQIATDRRSNWTTKTYIKICSQNLNELREWAKRAVGGDLQQCGFCDRETSLAQPSLINGQVPEIATKTPDESFSILWRPDKELVVRHQLEPLKASWEKSTHDSQVRLREYRQMIREYFASCVTCDHLYLDLHVALSDSKQLLNGNDLENYLTPLFECGCLPAEAFRLVYATKSVGGSSRLSIGTAIQENATARMRDFSHLSITPMVKPSSDTEWKKAIQAAILLSDGQPLPDGEVEVQIAWKCPLSRRNWFRLWKSTGDAMGPILGTYQRKNQYDPKDDRITKLMFHFLPDESLGKSIAIGLWWRMRPVTTSSA